MQETENGRWAGSAGEHRTFNEGAPAFNEPNEPGHTEASTTRMNVGGGHCCRNEGTFAFWGVCVCNLHVKLVDVYGRTFMVFMAREHVWCMHGSSFQICGGGRWARP